MMVKAKVFVWLLVVGVMGCAFAHDGRQAQSQVPEYVLKYGKHLFFICQTASSLSYSSKTKVHHFYILSPFPTSTPISLSSLPTPPPTTSPSSNAPPAPLVYLHSTEQYFPTSMPFFLNNTTPRVNFHEVAGPSKPLTPSNLNQMAADVFLTSNDDVTKDPAWIRGVKPDGGGSTGDAVTAAVIIVDKGEGVVDVFYMYFYAYNYGGEVLGLSSLNFGMYAFSLLESPKLDPSHVTLIPKMQFADFAIIITLGNHVGDWEHTMVRFSNGSPQAIWYSQHANGQAFTYPTVMKYTDNIRPLAYSSKGSHANYAIPGTHDHTIPNLNLPGGVLEDYTDEGVLWDPLLSAWFYKFDAGTGGFTALGDGMPTEWLEFKGRWGDEEYPESDTRQKELFGQVKFSSGPTGPADKQLNRKEVCPDNGLLCIVRRILVPRSEGDETVVY
ncbi:hypothetical protein J1614_007794 [Plenodomus biglobosus]|nr:hypothetical protein J1614_007794 [Plenodomus biglobosus]